MKVYEAQYCSGTEDVCVGRGERHGFAEEYTASLPVEDVLYSSLAIFKRYSEGL